MKFWCLQCCGRAVLVFLSDLVVTLDWSAVPSGDSASELTLPHGGWCCFPCCARLHAGVHHFTIA